MEPARLRLPVVAVAVVIALAVGVAIGFTAAPGDSNADATAPQGREAGTLVQGSRVVDGVRVGYPRTSAGAAAAAVTYGNVLNDPRVFFNKKRRERLSSMIGTKRFAETFRGAGGRALDAVKRRTAVGRGVTKGERTIYLAGPLTYKVTDFTQDRAVVRTWGVALAGNDAGFEPRASWDSIRIRMVWQEGDWKTDVAKSSDGPTPAPTSEASSGADLLSTVDDSRSWSYAP